MTSIATLAASFNSLAEALQMERMQAAPFPMLPIEYGNAVEYGNYSDGKSMRRRRSDVEYGNYSDGKRMRRRIL